jgi:RNA polymerase sigma-70 factor (ECF subfamily)
VAASLFATTFRILRDAPEAEEVVQDVFVQIWNKASTFDVELGTPFHWAMSIARNRSIDRLRSRQRRAQMLDQFQNVAAIDAPGLPAPPGNPLAEDELAAVRAALDHLPDDQRRALEMAFFGGLTHTEIAQATGEPLGTVKARIRRAMLKLRDTLQAYA